MSTQPSKVRTRALFVTLFLFTIVATSLVTALLVNISERKNEAKQPYVRLQEVTEDTTDPAVCGVNWPREYDSY